MDDDHDNGSKASKLLWAVPALTFLGGLVLGGVLVGVAVDRDAPEAPVNRTAPAAPAPANGQGGVTVAVPGPCLEAVDRAEEALTLAADGLSALQDFDPYRLGDLVDQLQRMEPEVRRQAAECRRQAALRPGGG
ncbi:MAG: hypothetical protein H0W56_10955 [Acidothermales bacterium]|jgi:hypothetical protein|nr:hypothetical protein [Acidothermales bacterium]